MRVSFFSIMALLFAGATCASELAAHKWIDYVLDPVAAGKEMNYHQYPVPVIGIKGVDPELAKDPVVNIPDEKLQGYESQIETAKGLQQRNRAISVVSFERLDRVENVGSLGVGCHPLPSIGSGLDVHSAARRTNRVS